MITLEVPLTSSPQDYSSWLECFKYLEKNELTLTGYNLLIKGNCQGYDSVKGYFNQQLVNTVNNLIKRNIAVFQKSLARYSDENCIDGLSQPFVRLSKKLELCMFFTELEFLDKSFKAELRDSAVKEITYFWQGMIDSLKKQAMNNHCCELEEEYFRIKRIRVLKNYIQ